MTYLREDAGMCAPTGYVTLGLLRWTLRTCDAYERDNAMSRTIPWACGGWVYRGAAHVSGRMRWFDTQPKHRAHISASTHALSQLSHRALVVGIPGRSFSKTPRRPSAVMHAFACSLSPVPHGAARAPFLIPLRPQARAHRTRRRRHPSSSACWPSASQCRTPQHTRVPRRAGEWAPAHFARVRTQSVGGRGPSTTEQASETPESASVWPCGHAGAVSAGQRVGQTGGSVVLRGRDRSRVRWGPGVARA